MEVPEFRSVVLGQLGESRLMAAIDSDISGAQSHARSLDADTKGALRHIHRRVATTILFESSGGQIDKVAHLPELRFALGELEVDTTSVDTAAFTLEGKSYFIRRVGSDGFKISHQPTMKKVVSDRRASLDEESEIKPAMRLLIQKEFDRGASIPVVFFPEEGTAVQDAPKLALVVVEPESEWTPACDGTADRETGSLRQQIEEWTKQRGKSPRLYPGSLVWCIKKPGRDFRGKVELWLAWKRVAKEIAEGTLGGDFDRSDRAELQSKVSDAEEAAKDEVWGGYRFVVIADKQESDGLKTIDLGAGHSSGSETLCGRVITALKSQALLNESVGTGYIERNWPPALKESGAWPLSSFRQSFLNGSLTRLLDPDTILRGKIVEFVSRGDFGLASGKKPDGGYERVLFNEFTDPAEVTFESGVFLLLKTKAMELKTAISCLPAGRETNAGGGAEAVPTPKPGLLPGPGLEPEPEPAQGVGAKTFRIRGDVPPEIWNRLGTRILPKLRNGTDLRIGIEFSVTIDRQNERTFEADLKQILEDLGLTGRVMIE